MPLFSSLLVNKSDDLLVEIRQEIPEQKTLVPASKTLLIYARVIQ